MIKHNPGNLELIPFGHGHIGQITINSRKYFQRTGAGRQKGLNGPNNTPAYSKSTNTASGGSAMGSMGGECELLGTGTDRATGYLGMGLQLSEGESYLGGLSLSLRTLDGNDDPRYIYRVGGSIGAQTHTSTAAGQTKEVDSDQGGIMIRPWLGWRYEWVDVRDTDRNRAKVVIHQYLPVRNDTPGNGTLASWCHWIQDMNGPAADLPSAQAASDWPSKPSGGGNKLIVTEMVMGFQLSRVGSVAGFNVGGSLWFDRIQGVDPGIINMPV